MMPKLRREKNPSAMMARSEGFIWLVFIRIALTDELTGRVEADSLLRVVVDVIGDHSRSIGYALVTRKAIHLNNRKAFWRLDQIDAIQFKAEKFAATAHEVGKLRIVAYRCAFLFLFGGGWENALDGVDIASDYVGFIVVRLMFFILLRKNQPLAKRRTVFSTFVVGRRPSIALFTSSIAL